MIWGRNAVANAVPAVIDFPLFTVFGSTFPAYKGLMMAISIAMFVFLYLTLKKTRIGLVIQAALTHPKMVSALGHDVPGVFVLVFAVGSGLAGLAGVIGGFMLLVAALALLPHIPGLDTDFGRSLLTQMAIAAVFALSFNLLFGQTGLLSFGHAVYFGLGGYAAILTMRAINQGLALPIVVVPIAGALGGLVAGIAFGAVTTRKAGTIFALISLGVGELVYAATFMLPGLFGGEEGITASRTRAAIDLGLPLRTQLAVYYAVVVWAVFSALAMYAFTRTPVGRMCNAVRDNPERAEFVGYSTQRVRFVAFAAAGLFAGLAGGLHAINYEIVAADAVSAQRSGTVLIMAYIGGAAHFIGPVLGAIVITWLQSSLSGYTSAWLFYLGVFFIVMIVYAPSGLAGLIMMHRALAPSPALG